MPKYRIVGIHHHDAYKNDVDLIGRIIEGPCVVGDNKKFSGRFDVLGECPECMKQPNNHYALHFIVEPHYEKTDWFSPEVNPVHVGVYEKDFNNADGVPDYQYWDGKIWHYGNTSVDKTLEMRTDPQAVEPYPRRWRGLKKAN